MSLLHLDFPSGQTGLYGTTTSHMLNGVYAEVANNAQIAEDPDPTIVGNVLYCPSTTAGDGPIVRRVLPSSLFTLGLGLRVWLPNLPTDVTELPVPMTMRNGSNVDMCSIRIETDGRISAYRGNWRTGTPLGTSASPAIVANAWQHLECKMFSDATTGTIEVRVEGVSVLTLTGQNTLGVTGPCTQYTIMSKNDGGGGTCPVYYKDIVVWDTAGTLNNDFMGSISVYELIPDGDTSLTWALSSGSTGYSLIDESPPVDSDYIYAPDPAPAPDKMSLTNLPTDVTSVRGLIAIVRSLKTDGGDGNLQIGMVSGVDTALGSDRPITTAATYWQDVFEVDPATSAAWTPTAVDAVEIQFDRTV